MKYRIKIINYSDGSVEYFAQKKWFIFWRYLLCDGTMFYDIKGAAQKSREESLERIDLNINLKPPKKVTSIKFEYINK